MTLPDFSIDVRKLLVRPVVHLILLSSIFPRPAVALPPLPSNDQKAPAASGQDHPQKDAAIVGTWQATLHSQKDLRFVVKISRDDTGSLDGLFYSIDHSGQALRTTEFLYLDGELEFAIGSINAKFTGKINARGTSSRASGPMMEIGHH